MPVTAESMLTSIAQMMCDIGPPPDFDTLQVGSMRYVRRLFPTPKDPRVSPSPYYAGLHVILNPSLPAWRGVVSGRRGKLAIIDFRKNPQTGDMTQMLEDLRRSGGAPA